MKITGKMVEIEALQEKIFSKVFEVAEVAALNPDQARSYQDSLKYYRDIKNSIDTAEEKGRLEERLVIARNMLTKGYNTKDIADIINLTQEEIEKLI